MNGQANKSAVSPASGGHARAGLLFWWAIALVLAPVRAGGQPLPVQAVVAEKVRAFEKATGARVGVSAIDLAAGKRAVAMRDRELLIPASNQKLLTGAFALVRLGGDYRFATGVFLTHDADLLVFGGFDPTLGDPVLARADRKSIYAELDRWAGAIAKTTRGGTAGDILVTVAGGANLFRHPDWPASRNHVRYQAPAARLNFHNNCFGATFTVSDGRITPAVAPASRFIAVHSSLRVGKGYWSLTSARDDSAVWLRGKVAGTTRVPVYAAANNPPMLTGRVLAGRLMRAGVAFSGRVRAVDPAGIDWRRARLICRTTTPLAKVMRRANKYSLNMASECMLLRAGDGTWSGGARAMTAALSKAFDLPQGAMVARDGSGLSRKNRVSPRAMARLLAGVARRKDASVLVDSLPRGGIDGTLARRMRGAAVRGRIAAKTGYIAGVSCLSGYVLGGDGRPRMAFSIMVNRMPGRVAPAKDLQDAICAVLVGAADEK